MLVGRHRECTTLDRLIKRVSADENQARSWWSEKQAWETALLDYVATKACRHAQ